MNLAASVLENYSEIIDQLNHRTCLDGLFDKAGPGKTYTLPIQEPRINVRIIETQMPQETRCPSCLTDHQIIMELLFTDRAVKEDWSFGYFVHNFKREALENLYAECFPS